MLESLDDNKAAAEDRTKNTAFKRGGPRMVSNLLALFNTLNRKEHLPANWASALVVNLYKDGDKTDAGNYRGISLISCLGKIYLSLWAKRLSRWCEGQLHDEQGGFRARRSTIDDALALKEILLKRLNRGISCSLTTGRLSTQFGTMASGNDYGTWEYAGNRGELSASSMLRSTQRFASVEKCREGSGFCRVSDKDALFLRPFLIALSTNSSVG